MKLLLLSLAVLALCASSYGGVLPKEKCTPEKCALPNCACSGTSPPVNINNPENNPQIVYLTFDDAITVLNYPLYQEIFAERKNPNGAPITGSFYISHEYNNYSLTHQMWRQGHEIASHSISHQTNTEYWKKLTGPEWKAEVGDHRTLISNFANIPIEDIVGFRAPFLQGGGDPMYAALSTNGIQYETSRPTMDFSPNLFPYTMDYDSIQDCQIEPCPKESYPGFWVSPIVDLEGSNGFPCAFVDTCQDAPKTKEETYELLMKNFENHHKNHRAPFGLYVHSSWLTTPETYWIKEGYLQFIDAVLALGDTYIVSTKKGLEWARNPVGLDGIKEFAPWLAPDQPPRNRCTNSIDCHYDLDHLPPGFWSDRYMSSCAICPDQYPWLGNPLGE